MLCQFQYKEGCQRMTWSQEKPFIKELIVKLFGSKSKDFSVDETRAEEGSTMNYYDHIEFDGLDPQTDCELLF
jgi:hypothetical protein